MKPSLTFKVSGIFALLFGLTFTPTSVQASRPDGYTDNGVPYYYAYPDEGYVDEETTDENSVPAETPPDQSMPQTDDYNASPYDDWSGTGWYYPFGGPGVPFGQHNIFSRPPRQGFGRHDGIHNNFSGNKPITSPHHNLGAGGKIGGRAAMGGGVRMGGGGHR